jgi:hypothetical protein
MRNWTIFIASTLVSWSAQTISFEPPRSFGLDPPALAGPNCLAAGDFNGDGRLDLVASNMSSDNLSLLLGNGDGTFQAAAGVLVPPVGAQNGLPKVKPDRCLVAADFNKDGRVDLAVVSGDSDRVLVLFGNGDGTFGQRLVLSSGVRAYFIAAADFNGDGTPDLIVAATVRLGTPFLRAADPSGIAVLLSRGAGTFQAPKILPVGPLGETLAIGDVNRDGKLDLVGTTGGGYTSVFSFWQGIGDGTFQAPLDHSFDARGFAYALGDVNGDGNLDVLATTTGGVLVFPGNGDGTFRPFVRTSTSAFLPAIKVADLNRDGRQDIVVGYGSSEIAVHLGKGDGLFEAPIPLSIPYTSATGVEVADFSSDGIPDLALANGDSIGVYIGRGSGNCDQLERFATTGQIYGLWPGDWNGNGNTDLIAYGQGRAWFFEGDGAGNFHLAGNLDLAASAVAAVDLNADGKTDLVVQLSPYELSVSLNQGGYRFAEPRRVFQWEPFLPHQPPIQIFVADLNRDGKLDLVIAHAVDGARSNFAVLLGRGDGTFSEPVSGRFNADIRAVADFNKDGIPDLLVTGPAILFGIGDGTVADPVIASGFPSTSCPEIGVADVDGDGVLDLLCIDTSWGFSWAILYRGDGSGGFYTLPPEQDLTWQNLGPQFADFSGDGIPDALIFPNIYSGNGLGGFSLATTLPYPGSNIRLAALVLDVNGNGKPDLVVPNGTHRFSVLLNSSRR